MVAFNREVILKRVISEILNQSSKPDSILVIDNCSTDGTSQMLVDSFPDVLYFKTDKNIGGAGGFSLALDFGIALGYDYVWLMDDDAIPYPNALEELVKRIYLIDETTEGAILASVPVDRFGTLKGANGQPVPSIFFRDHFDTAGYEGLLPIRSAAFLGILVSASKAAENYLPNPNFFIWCDDLEYTSRMLSKYKGYAVFSSRLIHESPEMLNIGKGSLGWKYFYQVRNRLWLFRSKDSGLSRADRLQSFSIAFRATITELKLAKFSRAIAFATIKAWSAGIFSGMRSFAPGSMIATQSRANEFLDTRTSGR